MKKIIFILILKVFLQLPGFTQNQFVNKLTIPQKAQISLLKKSTPSQPAHNFYSRIFVGETEMAPLLSFNDHALVRHKISVKKPISVLSELSFSDVLEDSMNSIKDGLVNTYDDHITELFRDAPSLFKIRFILRL